VRQVVSGLAKFLTLEQIQNRKVLVLRNVKPGKVRDILSSGLVLCASNTDHTQCEPVMPPDGARIGERITVAGCEEGSSSPEEILNPKKKQFENLQPDLTTDDAGVANYQGKPFMTTAGACTSSIVNGTINDTIFLLVVILLLLLLLCHPNVGSLDWRKIHFLHIPRLDMKDHHFLRRF